MQCNVIHASPTVCTSTTLKFCGVMPKEIPKARKRCSLRLNILSYPVWPLLFFFTRSGVFLFLSGVLGFFDSGQILEMYVVLLYFPFKNTVISQA